jgi:hypothetical protein
MRLTHICGTPIFDENDEHIGQVVDLRCTEDPGNGEPYNGGVVTELICGKAGWLERLGFCAIEERRIAWNRVRSITAEKVVVAVANGDHDRRIE